MLKSIYDKLSNAKLNPHFIGQYKGICEDPYLIIKQGTQMASLGTNQTGQSIVDIITFVPARNFSKLSEYERDIKVALKELDYLRKTGLETPAIADDEKKAYTSSIEYILMKKLEG